MSVGHVLDHVLDHIILVLVIMALHLNCYILKVDYGFKWAVANKSDVYSSWRPIFGPIILIATF